MISHPTVPSRGRRMLLRWKIWLLLAVMFIISPPIVLCEEEEDDSQQQKHSNIFNREKKKKGIRGSDKTTKKAAKGLGKLKKGKDRTDLKGNSHERYQLTFDEVPIFGRHEVVRVKGGGRGDVRSKSDFVPPKMTVDTTPTISLEDAKATAKTEAMNMPIGKNSTSASVNDGFTVENLDEEINIYLERKVPHLVYKCQNL